MENFIRKQIKMMLLHNDLKLKDLAPLLTERMNKKYSSAGLSQKISRKTLSYEEMVVIADILGCDLKPVRRADDKSDIF